VNTPAGYSLTLIGFNCLFSYLGYIMALWLHAIGLHSAANHRTTILISLRPESLKSYILGLFNVPVSRTVVI
jgi:hypothetical protein